MSLHDTEADAGVLFDLLLELSRKVFVRLVRHDGQRVDVEPANAFSVLVDGQPETAADLLPLLDLRGRLVKGADLKDVGTVPTFAKGRVGEDEDTPAISA